MKWGRCELALDTGQDFRFDISAWREYLLQNEEDSYLWNEVAEREVLAAIADPAWHAFAAAMPADDAHEKEVLECLERHKVVLERLAVEQAERYLR